MKQAGDAAKRFTVMVFLGALLSIACWPPPSSIAADEGAAPTQAVTPPPWEILARSLSYDSGSGIYRAEGDVILRRENQILSSQAAEYHERTGIAEVPGPFRLDFNGDVLTGHEGMFDLEKETGRIERGELFLRDSNLYLRAEEMEKKGKDRYFLSGCLVTTCDGDRPVWSITGSEADVTLEEYGTVKHAAFRVRDVPVLYIPYFVFPAKTKRQTGLLPPTTGYSGRKGMDLEIPFFWAVSDSTDATFYQRYLTSRGYMQGLEYRYMASEDSGGAFLLDIMSDRRKVKDLTDPDELDLSPFERTNTTRYWARGRADQEFPLDIRSRLDLDFVSDQDYLREFEGGGLGLQARPDLGSQWGRPLEEIRAPTRRSALRLSRDGELYSLQAGMEYHQRPENLPADRTPQPLAGALFDLMPRRVFDSPLHMGLKSDLDYIWRDTGATGYRTSASPSLSIPFSAGPYLRVEPFSQYTIAHQRFDGQAGGQDTRTRQVHESGLQLSSDFDRVFKTGFLKATSVNHRLRPVLIYRYRGPGDKDVPAPWFEPVDQQGRVNQVALSLRNYLDARYDRNGRTSYRQWGYLILDQAFAIDRARADAAPGKSRRPLDPLIASLGVNPAPNLTGRLTARWDHYERAVTSTNASIDMAFDRAVGYRDHYTLDYNSNRQQGSKYLGISADVYVAGGVSVGGSLQRELRTGENIAQQGRLSFERQCWGMRFAISRAENSVGFSVTVNLRGLGGF